MQALLQTACDHAGSLPDTEPESGSLQLLEIKQINAISSCDCNILSTANTFLPLLGVKNETV